MAALDVLQARLEALKKACDSGVLIIRHGDEQVTYRTMAEMLQAIAALQGEINSQTGKTRGPKYVRQTGRG